MRNKSKWLKWVRTANHKCSAYLKGVSGTNFKAYLAYIFRDQMNTTSCLFKKNQSYLKKILYILSKIVRIWYKKVQISFEGTPQPASMKMSMLMLIRTSSTGTTTMIKSNKCWWWQWRHRRIFYLNRLCLSSAKSWSEISEGEEENVDVFCRLRKG